ncbi:hypothetical protein, partial [Mesorhizobium sp.]|uniref:hypothetical protein n=1 Tax=Mesorhizobium sp. TaxID=1871066 RepID=UPI00257E978C
MDGVSGVRQNSLCRFHRVDLPILAGNAWKATREHAENVLLRFLQRNATVSDGTTRHKRRWRVFKPLLEKALQGRCDMARYGWHRIFKTDALNRGYPSIVNLQPRRVQGVAGSQS